VFAATILVLVFIIGLQRRRSSGSSTTAQVSPATSPQRLNSQAPLPESIIDPPTTETPPGSSTRQKGQASVSNSNSSSTADPNRVFTSREVSEKARLTYKPQPSYSEEARQNQIQGTVVLRVVFAANGAVENIKVVSGLPFGLTERAVDAAQRIRFIPATKDGVPVSMWMQLEYNFNLY
jgi:TonB family protein